MLGAKNRLNRQAWLRVYRKTGLLTAISVVLSIVMTNAIMETFSSGINVAGLMVSIVTPLALGAPAIGLVLYKQEQLRAANTQLQKLASFDWLTGCLNRGAFTAMVSQSLSSGSVSGALLVIDVDHFKSINDNHGHDRGDDALKLIATTLQQTAGENAPLGRLGGEEFGIFLHRLDERGVARMAERLRAAVARLAFVTDGHGCPLSISIGGATFSGQTDFRTLYKMADICLYQAKSAGRDRIALIDAA
ncbi:GGDEF domain-containing protein [Devosia sp. YIM 151766]|uniref:GGDEF domain-containing protein n=1 Tax=Devosia sp. YIM 151766 TaxID=3017325 RepID=UPI00255C76AE|nr:GGDEF domain-containing protein [Devosia sp. YIM 151766]WIY52192.1 GGDEF domain-containing protein [Devosia sp. YIM 151766]